MAKTKVVFIEETPPHGRKGDLKEVAGGFFRNLLFPRGSAVLADPSRIAWAHALQQKRAQADQLHQERLQAYAKDLNGVTLEFVKKANEQGGLFDAVDRKEVLAALHQKGFTAIEEKHLDMEKSYHTVGEHILKVVLAEDLPTPTLNVVITQEEK
jgi:large subunit ribosomal protein L9